MLRLQREASGKENLEDVKYIELQVSACISALVSEVHAFPRTCVCTLPSHARMAFFSPSAYNSICVCYWQADTAESSLARLGQLLPNLKELKMVSSNITTIR